MPSLGRRQMLAGSAATGAIIATASFALPSRQTGAPDLSGRSVLITGCSSGFGYLGALHYARLGARVFATMRNLPRPEAGDLEQIARLEALDISVIELDVLDQAQIDNAMAQVGRALGGSMVDVLVNNAGIGITSPIEVQDMEATRLMFETNVYGPHRMVRAVLPGMRARGSGLIIQVSSQLGRVIVPHSGHYSATKFALEAMGEQLAYELVPHNIDVSIIEPGGYPTRVWANSNAYSAALRERASKLHANGYPQQVARMGREDGSDRNTDPMDVPRAIAGLIAAPAGTRPLRVPVHPRFIPQLAINEVTAKTQVQWLGETPYGPVMRAVHTN